MTKAMRITDEYLRYINIAFSMTTEEAQMVENFTNHYLVFDEPSLMQWSLFTETKFRETYRFAEPEQKTLTRVTLI